MLQTIDKLRFDCFRVGKVKENKSIIDIGGNCGLFSVPVAKDGFDVYSFEPIKMNIDLLELNKKENNCKIGRAHV